MTSKKLTFSNWRLLALTLLFAFSLSSFSGCRTSYAEADTEWRSFSGQMVWVPRGLHGFWGIQTKEHGRIHPLGEVPESVQRNRTPVEGELLLRPDMSSIRGWGRMAEIRELRPAN